MTISFAMKYLWIAALALVTMSESCSPYQYGPYNKEKEIHEVFPPILEFMDYKPGMTFADVGASSGAITVMMATLMDSSSIYIQDIDTSRLKASNVEKISNYYSKRSKIDLRRGNNFKLR